MRGLGKGQVRLNDVCTSLDASVTRFRGGIFPARSLRKAIQDLVGWGGLGWFSIGPYIPGSAPRAPGRWTWIQAQTDPDPGYKALVEPPPQLSVRRKVKTWGT